MTQNEQVYQFAHELDNLVARVMAEYDLTAASIIGTLAIKQLAMYDLVKKQAEGSK